MAPEELLKWLLGGVTSVVIIVIGVAIRGAKQRQDDSEREVKYGLSSVEREVQDIKIHIAAIPDLKISAEEHRRRLHDLELKVVAEDKIRSMMKDAVERIESRLEVDTTAKDRTYLVMQQVLSEMRRNNQND